MSEHPTEIELETAVVTDRGLSQKRPHNEDSYLLDAERRIFAVADGVGGANAGEVASSTAVEVLAEAFRHHQPGEDVEDLLEIAIQRANASIFQMSREQEKFSMMATTLVALHLDGRRATIAHVGDSRLYSLRPDGKLRRETDDHSVVEEEVRAGRMTAEQAAHHPSRNVISRALGAEAAVEVDLNTVDVEDGTVFLLCSDGITRHIPDAELNALLRDGDMLEAACAEMKRLCFERGAEDNLTAVVIRVGARAAAPAGDPHAESEAETTLVRERTAAVAAAAVTAPLPNLPLPNDDPKSPRPTRIAGPVVEESAPIVAADTAEKVTHAKMTERSPVGRAGGWLATLLLLLLVGAGAFYGGLKYQEGRAAETARLAPEVAAVPTPVPTPLDSYANYVRLREQVDSLPTLEAGRMAGENNGRPLESGDAEFLTLYGRALLLSGRNVEAVEALKLATQKIDSGAAPVRDAVKVDARLALAAAALRGTDEAAKLQAAQSLSGVIQNTQPGVTGSTTPGSPTQPPAQSPSPFR